MFDSIRSSCGILKIINIDTMDSFTIIPFPCHDSHSRPPALPIYHREMSSRSPLYSQRYHQTKCACSTYSLDEIISKPHRHGSCLCRRAFHPPPVRSHPLPWRREDAPVPGQLYLLALRTCVLPDETAA